MSMYENSLLLKAMQDVVDTNQINYGAILGKVSSVSNNGLTINVSLIQDQTGSQDLTDVPVVKNPYINAPVNSGDFVLLIKTAYTLGTFMSTGSLATTQPEISMYFALPISTTSVFGSTENEVVLESSQGQSTITLKDSALEAEVQGSVTISGAQEISITSQSGQLEIGNSVGTLADIITDICTALTNLSTNVVSTTGSAAAQSGMATFTTLTSDVAQIQAKLAQILK